MNIVQYGDWKISVDTDKTEEHYAGYTKSNSQVNRNFGEYCKNLTPEEQAFFDAFHIDPLCCEIEHAGASKQGEIPCGGYYLVCGTYLSCPPEVTMTVEQLVENDFVDDRPDPCVHIGAFEFDFQREDSPFSIFPENMPEGFICIRFWCENMKWLLSETPEVMMYEPPRFWEIGKRIRQKREWRIQALLDLEEAQQENARFFETLGIVATVLDKKQVAAYKKEWIDHFAPPHANRKEIRKLCLSSCKYTAFLWHIFSFEYLDCETGKTAKILYDQTHRQSCILIHNDNNLAYRLQDGQRLTAEALDGLMDVTVTAEDFSWTYSKTHEEMCGPYFYKG